MADEISHLTSHYDDDDDDDGQRQKAEEAERERGTAAPVLRLKQKKENLTPEYKNVTSVLGLLHLY